MAKKYLNSHETADFDKAISLTGYGRFHYEAIAVCGLSIITVGFQNGLSPFVFPAAQCELHLTSFELGVLNVTFLLGGIISCFLWGTLADINGRRTILVTTHLLNAFATVICAFISYKSSLIICRFFNGFLIGAPGAIIFTYLAEFQPPKYRSASVCYCGLFFTLSWLLLPASAHFVLPLGVNYKIGNLFTVTPWRLYLIFMIIPEVTVGLWLTRLPESPKFYMAKGNSRKTLSILRKIYSINTGEMPSAFPVKYLTNNSQNGNSTFSNSPNNLQILLIMLKQGKILFKTPFIVVTALTCTIMFSNMFGIYGLGLWIPELFIRFKRYQDLHPNDTITVKELSAFDQNRNLTCEPFFDPTVIQGTVAMAATSLLYNLISGLLSIKIQAKIISAVSMILGGLSAGCIYWLRTSLENLAVACIFQATMLTANMTIGSIAVDLFPTKVSAVALCLIMCTGRLGAICSNIMFGFLIDKHCEVPIFVVAGVISVGAALCVIIPNKINVELNTYKNKKDIELSVIS